jgi:hypothetical protein
MKGRQHFESVKNPRFLQQEEIPVRDKQKREACKNQGITLIEIPYWWDQVQLL